jgi:hypothetical protein
MYDDLSSNINENVQRSLGCLLTLPLARLLRNRRPWDLLQALNENVEQTTKIWNIGMRKELLEFTLRIDNSRNAGVYENDLDPSFEFVFTCLRDELCIGGVYVRIFNKTGEVNNIDFPSKFGNELIDYIRDSIKDNQTNFENEHLFMAVEAVSVLTNSLTYMAQDIAEFPSGIETVFLLLELEPSSQGFMFTLKLFCSLFSSADFIIAVAKKKPSITWRFVKCLCSIDDPFIKPAWVAAEALASHPEGLASLLEAGIIIHLLGILLAVTEYSSSFQSRMSAISLLIKFLLHPVKGSESSALLRRYDSISFLILFIFSFLL